MSLLPAKIYLKSLLARASYGKFPGHAPDAPQRITAHELKKLMESGRELTLIDIRYSWEFRYEHIPGSICIPLHKLYALPGLSEFIGKKVVIICTAGVRSIKARKMFIAQGISGTVDLAGGINAWVEMGGETASTPG